VSCLFVTVTEHVSYILGCSNATWLWKPNSGFYTTCNLNGISRTTEWENILTVQRVWCWAISSLARHYTRIDTSRVLVSANDNERHILVRGIWHDGSGQKTTTDINIVRLVGQSCIVAGWLMECCYSPLYSLSGCLQLLEMYWNLKTILEISCVECRWSNTLVSSHDKTGYWITYLRNWSPLFYLCHGSMLCISCFCYIFRQTSGFGTLHSRPKQCKRPGFFLKFLLEISWKFVQLNL